MNYTLCLLETITQSEQKVIGRFGVAVVVVVVVVVVVFCATIRRNTTFDTKLREFDEYTLE